MESAHPSSEGPSNNSSSTDVSRVDLIDPLDPNKTHHLLKHCLSDGQRNEALDHFGTQDVKDAAREISKMGQRELQSKFKLVYGAATHSNNNDWLRRKLYEGERRSTTRPKGLRPLCKATTISIKKNQIIISMFFFRMCSHWSRAHQDGDQDQGAETFRQGPQGRDVR